MKKKLMPMKRSIACQNTRTFKNNIHLPRQGYWKIWRFTACFTNKRDFYRQCYYCNHCHHHPSSPSVATYWNPRNWHICRSYVVFTILKMCLFLLNCNVNIMVFLLYCPSPFKNANFLWTYFRDDVPVKAQRVHSHLWDSKFKMAVLSSCILFLVNLYTN
jgi:hypothetical protein